MMDSDADALEMCSALLQGKGFSVMPVSTEEEFSVALQGDAPGVIFINTYAGAAMTTTLMTEISGHDSCRDTPVVCYFADEEIYLVRRNTGGGRMEFHSLRTENLETVLQQALSIPQTQTGV